MNVLTVFFILLVGSKPCAGLQAFLSSFELRRMSDRLMPEQILAKLTTVDNVRVDLNLRHVPHLDAHLPLEFISVDAEGRLVTRAEHIRPSSDVSYYQDAQSKAAIQLTRYWDRTHELFGYNMRGHVIFQESVYYLDTEMENANQSETRYQFLTSPSPKEPPVQIVSLEGRQLDLVLEKSVEGLKCQEHYAANETKDGVHGEKTKRSGRPSQGRKSRSSDMYILDITAVVDYGLYIKMKETINGPFPLKLYEHFAFLFNEVDLLYKNLGTSYTLNIRLNKLLVSEDKDSASYTETISNEGEVDAGVAIGLIKTFISTNSKNVVEESDHVMVFTSYDLLGVTNKEVNRAVAGIANNGVMCRKDGTSCSIIEHHSNGFLVVIIITHELGHSLSSPHDGLGNDCSPNDRYIMSPSNAPETTSTIMNPFKFSQCSVNYFTQYVNLILPTQEGRDCLTKSYPVSETIPVVSDRLLGLEMSVDEQCEELRGNGSEFCRHQVLPASKVCTNLLCSSPSNPSICRIYTPHSGTPCGKKKICRLGKCESDSRGPDVKDTCVFGEPSGIVAHGKTCKELIDTSIMYCYDGKLCCGTCGERYRPIKGCEYGNKMLGCTESYCAVDPKSCCETCKVGDPLTTKEEMLTTLPVPGVDHESATKDQAPTSTMKTSIKANIARGDSPADRMTVPLLPVAEGLSAIPPRITAPTVTEPFSCAHKMYNERVFLFSCLCYFLLFPLSI